MAASKVGSDRPARVLPAALRLSMLGLGLTFATAWLGCELVYQVRVTMNDGAGRIRLLGGSDLTERGLTERDPGQ